ncbi:MAG: hypothetical protein KA170_01705 [Candidatus Promineofilum sp.]|nr:hypothetical protein [Promineifilum sp.]
MYLKQSTAITVVLGPFVDDTDGKTAETSLTLSQADIRLSKNAGTFAQKADTGAASHMENGYYACGLNTTDTNTLGRLRIAVHESGALPVWRDFSVIPANVYDSLFSTDKLQVHAVEIDNDLITAAAIAANAITAAKLASDAVAEIADAVWDEALSGHATAGSTGEALDDAAAGSASAAAIADAVWDEALSGHLTIGSTGEALDDAGGAATDPWNTTLPGAYSSGTAGWILGSRIDAKVSSISGNSPGSGATEFIYTLTETGSGDPIADADVWATTDAPGSNVVASGRTNQYGVIAFYLDPGTVYIWRQKSGYNFTNPDTETVV